MCKDCITKHLTQLLETTRVQAVQSEASGIELRLTPVRTCVPFKCKEVEVAASYRILKFPGPNIGTSRTFAIILRLCEQILLNLNANKVVTTRDLYYKDVALFKTQVSVVRGLERLCRCLLIPRSALNVQPAPSGLVAGDMTIVLENGELQEVRRGNGSTLIPVQNILHVSAPRPPKYILVVEKEAVFSYLQNELSEGIIITGKGFPDRATRHLITALTLAFPHTAVYCLVDSDPHGVLILRSYECGSSRSIELQTPIPIQYLGISLLEYTEGLVQSTTNDVKVAMSTLRKPWINEPKYKLYKQELQRGLFMGLKGEMNLLDQDQSSRLSNYVRTKIQSVRQRNLVDDLASETQGPSLIVHDGKSTVGSKRMRSRLYASVKARKRVPYVKEVSGRSEFSHAADARPTMSGPENVSEHE